MKHLTPSVVLLALVSACAQAGDDSYGLLFTTPDQRARLDNRFTGPNESDDSRLEAVGAKNPQAARPLKLNGTLFSSAGKKEVWINGESQLVPGESPNGRVRVLNTDRVRVKPTTSSQAHDMKPGQVLDPNTGTVSEAYEQTLTVQSQTGDAP